MAMWGQHQMRRAWIHRERFLTRLFDCAVALVLVGVVVTGWRAVNPRMTINVSAETVAAMQIPYTLIEPLQTLSAKHDVDFATILTLYCAEHGFYPNKFAVPDLDTLEQVYVSEHNVLSRKYSHGSVQPYADMFAVLFAEIVFFPIPLGHDTALSYTFSDSWGALRNHEGDEQHQGTDIIDRENMRGRIPIVSMTNGSVQDAGWDVKLGYYVGIVTENNTYYLYAHLDSLHEDVVLGQLLDAGHPLGFMGDSGQAKNATFQTHLHIGIAPSVTFVKDADRYWINPYPLLRYIENRKVPMQTS